MSGLKLLSHVNTETRWLILCHIHHIVTVNSDTGGAVKFSIATAILHTMINQLRVAVVGVCVLDCVCVCRSGLNNLPRLLALANDGAYRKYMTNYRIC